jgi:hypothetical protein
MSRVLSHAHAMSKWWKGQDEAKSFVWVSYPQIIVASRSGIRLSFRSRFIYLRKLVSVRVNTDLGDD